MPRKSNITRLPTSPADDVARQRAAIRGLRDVAIEELRRVIQSKNAAAQVAAIKIVLDELLQQPVTAAAGVAGPVEINFRLEGVGDDPASRSA